MLLHAIYDATIWLPDANYWTEMMPSVQFDWSIDHLVLAQQIRQTDLVGDIQKAFDNFVKTGQAWAFLIGLLLGYFIKTFTSFG